MPDQPPPPPYRNAYRRPTKLEQFLEAKPYLRSAGAFLLLLRMSRLPDNFNDVRPFYKPVDVMLKELEKDLREEETAAETAAELRQPGPEAA